MLLEARNRTALSGAFFRPAKGKTVDWEHPKPVFAGNGAKKPQMAGGC
jgi:hypothetical protein